MDEGSRRGVWEKEKNGKREIGMRKEERGVFVREGEEKVAVLFQKMAGLID